MSGTSITDTDQQEALRLAHKLRQGNAWRKEELRLVELVEKMAGAEPSGDEAERLRRGVGELVSEFLLDTELDGEYVAERLNSLLVPGGQR